MFKTDSLSRLIPCELKGTSLYKYNKLYNRKRGGGVKRREVIKKLR
jgi:hypothetical protein